VQCMHGVSSSQAARPRAESSAANWPWSTSQSTGTAHGCKGKLQFAQSSTRSQSTAHKHDSVSALTNTCFALSPSSTLAAQPLRGPGGLPVFSIQAGRRAQASGYSHQTQKPVAAPTSSSQHPMSAAAQSRCYPRGIPAAQNDRGSTASAIFLTLMLTEAELDLLASPHSTPAYYTIPIVC
jgi:hypothetical protein